MPVTPPIEQEFLNVHKYVADSEIHPPLGYRTGNVETYPVKTIHGELVWNNNLMQNPVIGFLDLGSSVSPNDGDRYIATGVGSSATFAGAAANDIIDYLTIDSYGQTYNAWDKRTPSTGMITYMSGIDTFYYFDGSIWKDLAAGITPTDKDNATVTLNGGANNGAVGDYVDLFTPAVGKIFESVLLKSTGLTPSDASISIVLHNGVPANDVEIMPAVTTAELEGVLFKYGCNGEIVSGGYSLKLLITDNTVTAGTVTVVANYLI
jgi:hypothetical protein